MLLRRLDWVFFVLLSWIALVLMRVFGWQGSDYVVSTALLLALWDTFKEHGVLIPYPHREVIMKTLVRIDSDGSGKD